MLTLTKNSLKFLLQKAYKLPPKKLTHIPGILSKTEISEFVQKVNKFQISQKNNYPAEFFKAAVALFYLKKGDTAIDCGAYIGDYSAFYKDLVSETGCIFSYEANPFVFKLLKKRLSCFPNVILKNKAISNTSDRPLLMKLFSATFKQCSSVETSLWKEIEEKNRDDVPLTVEVRTEKLDDLLNSPIPRCSLIKIDVEGHEPAVLDGASQLIDQHRPIIIFEYRFIPGYQEPKTIAQLEEKQYRCFLLDTLELAVPSLVHTHPTDLLGVPEETLDQFYSLRNLLSQLWMERRTKLKRLGLLWMLETILKRRESKVD